MARVLGCSVEVAAISSVLSVEAGGVDGRLVRASEQAAEGQRLREFGWGREACCSRNVLVSQCVQEECLCGRIVVRGKANWVEDDAGEAVVFQESGCSNQPVSCYPGHELPVLSTRRAMPCYLLRHHHWHHSRARVFHSLPPLPCKARAITTREPSL